jgi:hypothetical protein
MDKFKACKHKPLGVHISQNALRKIGCNMHLQSDSVQSMQAPTIMCAHLLERTDKDRVQYAYAFTV